MGGCVAKPTKKAATKLKLQMLPLFNPTNYTIKIIPFSFFYNLVVKDLNREASNQPKKDNEYIDFREIDKYKENHLKSAMNIDISALKGSKEELYKSLKLLLDFKNMIIIGDNLVTAETVITETVVDFIKSMENAKINLNIIYILNCDITDVLDRFPFFSHERDSSYNGKQLPLLLYSENDKVNITKNDSAPPTQTDVKYRVQESPRKDLVMQGAVFMQEYSRFAQSLDTKTYLEVLEIKLTIIASINNSNSDAIKSAKEKMPVVFIDSLSNKKAINQTFTKLFKQKKTCIIVHEKKEVDNVLNSFISFLELQQKFHSTNLQSYIEERIPKLKSVKPLVANDIKIEISEQRKLFKGGAEVQEEVIKSRLEEIDELMVALKKACKGNMDEVGIIHSLISRIIDNLIKNPEEQKYRNLNENNQKLKETIFKYEASKKLIGVIGFHKKEGETLSQLYNPLDVNTLKHIKVDVDIGYKNLQNNQK